ncbi:unnamed protein product [Orchesella dallaii]|uniref:Uncharacterized protein n=1 Tax=Orchesella dallaii TaxID=48710 RepID=A0ABP1S8M3_9HEXA
MLPILIFFICIDDNQKEFYRLDFTSLYYSPFLQIPYQLLYSTNKTNSILEDPQIKSEPENITFICKFCNNSNRSESVEKLLSGKNYFTEISVTCLNTVSGEGCRSRMHETYLRITGDGKYFTYFNFESVRFKLEKIIKIQKASSAYKVIKTGSKLDEIIFSILIEGMPLPYNPQIWHYAKQFPAVGIIQDIAYAYTNLQTESESFNFLTCDGKLTVPRFKILLEPFNIHTWFVLLSCVVLTIVVMRVLEQNIFPKEEHISIVSILTSITAFHLNTAVDNRSWGNSQYLRRYLAIWLFASIILSNAYRGDHFSKILAPRKIDEKAHFSQIQNFVLYTKDDCVPSQGYLECSQFVMNFLVWLHTELGAKLFERFRTMLVGKNYHALSLTAFYNETFLMEQNFAVTSDRNIARLFLRLETTTVRDFLDVERMVGKCDGTAYVAEQKEILNGVKYFRRNCNPRMYSGRDALFLKTGIWYAQESGGYYMRNRLRYLSYSGIHQHWMQLIELSHNSFPTKSCNEDESDYTSLSMASNILVIFYAVVCGWGISVMGLTIEYAVSNNMKLRCDDIHLRAMQAHLSAIHEFKIIMSNDAIQYLN